MRTPSFSSNQSKCWESMYSEYGVAGVIVPSITGHAAPPAAVVAVWVRRVGHRRPVHPNVTPTCIREQRRKGAVMLMLARIRV